ncbi:hypothetical protein VRRI112168_20355 [Vreelandella rituensis]
MNCGCTDNPTTGLPVLIRVPGGAGVMSDEPARGHIC